MSGINAGSESVAGGGRGRNDRATLLARPSAALHQQSGDGAEGERADRFGHGDDSSRRGTVDRYRRALQLERVVDDSVIPCIDDAVVIQVAVRVTIRAGELKIVVDQAVVAGIDKTIKIHVARVRVD